MQTNEERNTLPILSKYELAAIYSARAEALANGKPRTIRDPGTTNPIEIAKMEYKAGKLPMKIERTWPDGKKEIWALSELQKF